MPSSSESNQAHLQELVARSRDGDRVAFRMLIESQQQYAYAVAFRLLHEEEDARDVVQEAFVRVWKNLSVYRQEIRFTTWFYKIVVNLCYDRMKSNSRRRSIFGYFTMPGDSAEVAQEGDLHEDLEHADLCECILAVAKRLPPMEQLIFHLRDVQNCSVEETAEIAGISIGSVKTNLCYARKKIRIAITNMESAQRQ